MSIVLSCRVPDEIADRFDSLLEEAGLKNRSQAVAAAILSWIRQREGGETLEDRLAARIQAIMRAELAHAQVTGAGTQKTAQTPQDGKKAAFLASGRR